MKAVVYDWCGRLTSGASRRQVEQPVPAEDEVLVKVHATTVNRTGLPPPRCRHTDTLAWASDRECHPAPSRR